MKRLSLKDIQLQDAEAENGTVAQLDNRTTEQLDKRTTVPLDGDTVAKPSNSTVAKPSNEFRISSFVSQELLDRLDSEKDRRRRAKLPCRYADIIRESLGKFLPK